MSQDFLARQSAFLSSTQRNRRRLLSHEQQRLDEELHECVHQPLITKMAARLKKESVVDTTSKFLLRKAERIEAMRQDLEEKELQHMKPPHINEPSRFLAVKRVEKFVSEGIVRPASSPGQRLYELAQHSSRQKITAIAQHQEQLDKSRVSAKARPERELLDLSSRLHSDAEERNCRLEQARLAHECAQENALKQLSWANHDASFIRSQVSRDEANFTLVSPFCQENDSDMRGSGERIATSKRAPHRSDATPPKAAEFEEKSALISDMSRLIAEKLERRSGISSSDRLRMPLDKDRNAANLTSGGSSQGSGHNSSSANGNCPRDDPKFEKWREQLLSWQHAKLQKLHEFRQQQDEAMAQSIQTKPKKLDDSGDLFFRKQLDKQMRHEQALESARAAKEKQELDSLTPRQSKTISHDASTRLLKSTATHEARIAARFRGDA